MSCNYNLDDNAHVQKSSLKWQYTSRFDRPIIYESYVAVVFKDKQDNVLCFKQLLSSMQTLNCPEECKLVKRKIKLCHGSMNEVPFG